MNRILSIFILGALLLIPGCAKKTAQIQSEASAPAAEKSQNESLELPQGSGWYYFSDVGIHPAKNPADIPARAFRPWTEAVRVSDAAIVGSSPAFLINHLGLMTAGFKGEPPALHTDSLFAGATAAGIYRTEGGTAIRMYRNSFFAEGGTDALSPESSNGPTGTGICIAGFDPATGKFTVSMAAKDFGLDPNAQCVGLDRIGSMWYASFKLEKAGKVDFAYLEFESFPTRDGSGAYDLSGIRKIASDSYQRSVSPFDFRDAPDSLKSTLAKIPATTAFTLKVSSRVGRSTQTYVRSGEGTPVDGTAFVSDELTAALFADGTFYYCPDSATGKTLASKLPALSTGYVYTNFVVSGKSLVCAWEEQRFYETGRAGILVTDLPDAVY